MCIKFEVITQTQRFVKAMNTHFYNFWHRKHSDSYHSNQNEYRMMGAACHRSRGMGNVKVDTVA